MVAKEQKEAGIIAEYGRSRRGYRITGSTDCYPDS